MKAYLELRDGLKGLENQNIQELVKSWDLSFKQLDDFVTSKTITKSQMISGLEQGLREVPKLLADLPSPIRDKAISKYNQVVSKTIPELL